MENSVKTLMHGCMFEACYEGVFTPDDFTDTYFDIARQAEKAGAKGVLFNMEKIQMPLTEMDRYYLVTMMSVFREKKMKVAALYHKQSMPKDEFDMTVARNRCIPYQVFADRESAAEWIKVRP